MPRELWGGLSTFLAMSYILVVNPAILSTAGADKGSVFWATVIASTACTIVMGIWANLPFVVAPGMEMNSYVVAITLSGIGLSWPGALGLVFWSGVLTVLVTLSGLREHIIDSIPTYMKASISCCVGILIGFIAMKIAGILPLSSTPAGIWSQLTTPIAFVAYSGFITAAVFDRIGFPGGPVVSVLVAWAVFRALGLTQESDVLKPAFRLPSIEFGILFKTETLGLLLTLFVLDFYGSIAKFVGLLLPTGLLVDGRVPNRTRALLVDGAGTAAGAVVGTTSMIVYVESAVGIGVGARTGVASVACGLLLALAGVFGSSFAGIPVVATAGTIALVGIRLLPSKHLRTGMTTLDSFVLVAMSGVMVATLALDCALLAGFGIYGLHGLFRKKTNPFMLASAAILGLNLLFK